MEGNYKNNRSNFRDNNRGNNFNKKKSLSNNKFRKNDSYSSRKKFGGYSDNRSFNSNDNLEFHTVSDNDSGRTNESGGTRTYYKKEGTIYGNGSQGNSYGRSSGGRNYSGGSRSYDSGGGYRGSKDSGRSSYGRGRGGDRKGRFVSKIFDVERYIQNTKNNKRAVSEEVVYTPEKFEEYALTKDMMNSLQSAGFSQATQIQSLAIPLIIEGKNILGISQTGSGKTGAFLIPLINKLSLDEDSKILITTPTRELAKQIQKETFKFLGEIRINIAVIIGGENMSRQIDALRKNARIIIGTPGRILDLMEQRKLILDNFNHVVIDEVDRMLDMGFVDDIKKIYNSTPKEKQTLFFSATDNDKVKKVARDLCDSYEEIRLSANKPNENVEQSVVKYSSPDEKFEKLLDLLKHTSVEKTIIFVETKSYANRVDKLLYENNFKVGLLHGSKSQFHRNKMIEKFKAGQIDILVATNVASRGIDINDITHVINFDPPQSLDDYIHRIGRTGRNGQKGSAITFAQAR